MSTVAEIERAIADMGPAEKREVFEFISASLKADDEDEDFPDLKALLMEIPPFGTDEDFARLREMPREIDLS